MRLAVGRLEGTGSVDLDMETKTVSVSYDPDLVDLGQVRAALAAVGYSSTVLT